MIYASFICVPRLSLLSATLGVILQSIDRSVLYALNVRHHFYICIFFFIDHALPQSLFATLPSSLNSKFILFTSYSDRSFFFNAARQLNVQTMHAKRKTKEKDVELNVISGKNIFFRKARDIFHLWIQFSLPWVDCTQKALGSSVFGWSIYSHFLPKIT